MKHKSIKRRNIKFKSIRLSKRRLSKRRLSKRRLSKRRLSKRRHTKKYRMRGGTTPLPEPVYQTVSNPLPAGDPASGQAKIEQQNAQQNQANKTLTGGKRSRGKRSRGKRSRGISKRLLKQRGGEATICGGSPLNGADGYGYVSPNNCLLVPTVNNPAAQSLAITAMNNLNIEATNGAGDRLVGK